MSVKEKKDIKFSQSKRNLTVFPIIVVTIMIIFAFGFNRGREIAVKDKVSISLQKDI